MQKMPTPSPRKMVNSSDWNSVMARELLSESHAEGLREEAKVGKEAWSASVVDEKDIVERSVPPTLTRAVALLGRRPLHDRSREVEEPTAWKKDPPSKPPRWKSRP